MKLFIVLFLLTTSGNALPLDSIDNKVDIECQIVNVLISGTFQNPKQEDDQSFDAELLIRFNANFVEQQMYITFPFWNRSLISPDALMVSFDTAKAWDRCFEFLQPCKMPLNSDTQFLMFTLIHTYPEYYFRLFQLPVTYPYYFVLNNTYNGCTNIMPAAQGTDAANHLADPTKYNFCACCGDYKPDPALKCPANPLNSHT